MILSTAPAIEGKTATVQLGIVGAEIIFGAMFIKDWLAEGADFWGGRNGVYEKVFEDARAKALAEIERKAAAKGATAVVGVRFEYLTLGATNGMMMVAATGTAVAIPFTAEEQRLSLESEELHYIDLGGQRRGPFSIGQLRELVAAGRLEKGAGSYNEAGAAGPTLGELLSNGTP
ncbi:MAG TPA: heavy metal-binding domain-containing protein [Lacunisphaera sp.]|nr:heavy metal-binding domain-containing protein [Lacunisphaera sp.]